MKGKKVIILGLGRSGEAAAKFCHREGAHLLLVDQVYSENASKLLGELENAEFCLQERMTEQKEIDFIVLSPGIPRELPEIDFFIQQKIPVLNEIELAHKRWSSENRGTVIALTGSNGKTTTVSMIAELLALYKKDVFLGGNIGIPFCEFFNHSLKADHAVLEISSFQLESLFEFDAQVRVLLNLSFTHGERYKGLEDYAKAKFRIARNPKRSQHLFAPFEGELIQRWKEEQDVLQVHDIPAREKIKKDLQQSYDLSSFKLLGDHNLLNLWVCFEVLKVLGFEDKKVNQRFIQGFKGIDYRAQFIIKNDDFWAINDAKSTNWQATLSAVEGVKNAPRPLKLILGGQERGQNDSIAPYWHKLSEVIDEFVLIAQSGESLEREIFSLNQSKSKVVHRFEGLKDYVDSELMEKKGTLLFSPAFPSFDQYKNYQKRGEDFTNLIKNYRD